MTVADKLFLDQLTLLVDENIAKSSLTSDTLAKEFCITQRHFNRKVKSVTGVDTTHFIRRRRMELACRLLTHTALPISEIYIRCGMESANYFSRVFKQEIGMIPSEYRKKHG